MYISLVLLSLDALLVILSDAVVVVLPLQWEFVIIVAAVGLGLDELLRGSLGRRLASTLGSCLLGRRWASAVLGIANRRQVVLFLELLNVLASEDVLARFRMRCCKYQLMYTTPFSVNSYPWAFKYVVTAVTTVLPEPAMEVKLRSMARWACSSHF